MGVLATLLDRARKGENLRSDNALALRTGLSRQAISKWRTEDGYPEEEHIALLAKMAGDLPIDWLHAVRAERATGAAREAWIAESRKVVGMVGRVGIEPTTSGLKVRRRIRKR